MDKRIGTRAADGRITLPEHDITGNAYSYPPAAMYDLTSDAFVCIPVGYDWLRLNQDTAPLRAMLVEGDKKK